MRDLWNNASKNGNAIIAPRTSKSAPCSPIKPLLPPPPPPPQQQQADLFHVAHKVPVGDSPYVKAKRVQLVDKDPDRAIALFWAAINAGDRVDSALKDMAIVMKQQNRAEEAIEAIKSLRLRCSEQAQESLDNILLDLYKRCGRLDDQIALLKHKLHLIQLGLAFNGKRTKTARSQGRKFQVSVEQEATRLLGNLGWALMQQENYAEAEGAYRRALLIGPDNNKMCNLGICLMKQGRVTEAKDTLKQVRPAVADGPRGVDSHLKAFERAQEMLRDLESKLLGGGRAAAAESWKLDTAAFFGSSSVWQPQPCVDFVRPVFADENVDTNRMAVGGGCAAKLDFSACGNALNIDAPPFYSKQVHDPLVKLKRTRSGNAAGEKKPPLAPPPPPPLKQQQQVEETRSSNRRRSLSFDQAEKDCSNKWLLDLLPDNTAFDEAIVAAVLAPVLAADDDDVVQEPAVASAAVAKSSPLRERNVGGKRLRVFQDITQSHSPRA